MSDQKKRTLISLWIPTVCLVLLALFKAAHLTGEDVIFPIRGYDPRDLLSGHYLQFQVDYGSNPPCGGAAYNATLPTYICLDTRTAGYSLPSGCRLFIKGECKLGRFEAGIERYYVPEGDARRLEALVRNHEASISVSVTGDGVAQIKDLLIQGRPWQSIQ